MLREFAQLTADLFPSLDSDNTREFLRQLRRNAPSWLDLYTTQLPTELTQGDIVEPIRFIVEDGNGDATELDAPGMLLSHSCDIDNDEYVILAACRPFSSFRQHPSVGDIRNNTFLSAFYLESVPKLGDQVVDLSILQSVQTKRLKTAIGDGSAERISSFTQLGYYFFIAKITVRFLRPQPDTEFRGSANPRFRERFRQAIRDILTLGRYLIFGSKVP
jgi:hypothetical protein